MMKHLYTKPLAALLSVGTDDAIRASVENENNLDVSSLFEI